MPSGLCRYESTAMHVSVDVCIIKNMLREKRREKKNKCKYDYCYFASLYGHRLLIIKRIVK